jgi:putative transposase
MIDKGLSERRSLHIIDISGSALCYEPAADRNYVLKKKVIALAQRHRRYGARVMYLKLGYSGEIVNHKRVDRLFVKGGAAGEEAQTQEDSP